MGRPTKLTPEVQEKIRGLISKGSYAKTAAEAAGIPEQRFYDWMDKGEQGKEPYKSFRESIKKAEAEAEAHASERVYSGKKQWVAAATWLERVKRERWSRSDRVAVDASGTIKVEVIDYFANAKPKESQADKSEK